MSRTRLENGVLPCAVVAGFLCAAGTASGHDSLGLTGGSWDRGAVNSAFNAAQPWVRKYYSPAGQCLTLAVAQLPAGSSVDLEMTVVAPNPRIRYVNDDGNFNVCFNCPKVNIDPTPVAGYYTVQVSQFLGQATNTDFILSFSRAPAGDAACNPATPPVP